MRILMVYPEYPPTFWSFKYALPFVNKKATVPPLGLLTVAPLLPEKWEKKLIDMNVEKLTDEEIKWADHVYISGMIVQKKSAKEVIKRAKTFDKFVAAGGPLFTTGHTEFDSVDSFVLGEGEAIISMFAKDVKKGVPKKIYTAEERPDIAKTPVPDWKLIKKENYASLSMQISRGCPFNCEFCDIIIMNGRVPRVKTPDKVIEELDAIYKAGWRGSVFVVDDNFIGNKGKIKKILEKTGAWMEEKKWPFTLYTEASIDLADDAELMGLMKRANFDSVFVGIETPDEETLKACGKVQNTNRNMAEKVRVIQRNGMQVQGGFILGFDTDNPGTFDRMIKFIQNTGIVTAMVGMLSALPETRLYKRLKKEGRLREKASGNNMDLSLNFAPKMNENDLIKGYKRVVETIFTPKNYYERIMVFLKEYKKAAKNTKIEFGVKTKALVKALWKLGIKGRGKIYFWKMFLWTFFRKPRLLPEAITLAIYGYHYRTVLKRSGE